MRLPEKRLAIVMFNRDPTLAGSVQSKKMRLRCVGRLVIGDPWTSDLEYDFAFGFAPNNTDRTIIIGYENLLVVVT